MTIHIKNSFGFLLKTKTSLKHFFKSVQLPLNKRALILSGIFALYGGLLSSSSFTAHCYVSLGNSFSFHAQIELK